MNRVTLIGRLTKDPQISYTTGSKPTQVARYSLAVDRRFSYGQEKTADYIPCVAFGKTAEFHEKYVRKGMKMGIDGHIQTGKYVNKDGKTVYTYDIVVDNIEFCEGKNENGRIANRADGEAAGDISTDGLDGFMTVADSVEEELPFS